MAYQYKMIQIPRNIRIKSKETYDKVAADYLENVVNEWAMQGWEFYRVDTIGIEEQPGCIAGLLGQKTSVTRYYVITFRKEI